MQNNIVHRTIDKVMTLGLITCTPYTSLAEAYELMLKNTIRRLPVIDKSENLTGLITKNDILAVIPLDLRYQHNLEETNRELSKIIVDAIMTKVLHSAYQTDTVGHAAEIMLNEKISGLPVIDVNGKLRGIITESDIFRLIVRQWRDDNLILSGARHQ